MKLQVFTALLIIGLTLAITTSSSLSCCRRYDILPEVVNQTAEEDNCTVRFSNLRKLDELTRNCSSDEDIELSFQPGVYFIESTVTNINFTKKRSLVINGENEMEVNATIIKCSINEVDFEIHHVKRVKVYNI